MQPKLAGMDASDEIARRALSVLATLRALDLSDDERRLLEDKLIPQCEMLPDRWAWIEARINDLQAQIDEIRGEQ